MYRGFFGGRGTAFVVIAASRARGFGDPNGTRTRVFAVKGRRPRPLDDGADAADRSLRQAARGGQPGGGAPSPGYTSTFAIAASQTGQKGRSVRCIRHSAVGR